MKNAIKLDNDLRLFSEGIEKASGLLVDLKVLSIEEEKEVAFFGKKSNYITYG